jgi:hypothetical protein
MADSEKLAQFMDVTGASQDAAKFFLDSAGGQVDTAVDQFFATGGTFEAQGAAEAVEAPPATGSHGTIGAAEEFTPGMHCFQQKQCPRLAPELALDLHSVCDTLAKFAAKACP